MQRTHLFCASSPHPSLATCATLTTSATCLTPGARLAASKEIPSNACAVAYTNDSYIKAKLSVALEVLSDIKHVLKEDDGLALNFDKTKILVKGISSADAHAAAQRMLAADPSLTHLSASVSPASFVVDCYIGLGVPIGVHR